MPNLTSTKSLKKGKDEKCPSCKKHESSSVDWIGCNICNKWFHSECVAQTTAEFSVLKSNDFWICKICIAVSNIKDDTKVAINMALNASQNKCNKLGDDDINNILEKIWPTIDLQIEKKIMIMCQEKDNIIKSLSERVSYLEYSQLKEERNRKNKNLIVQGVPNSVKVNDPEFIATIARHIKFDDFSMVNIDQCYRMGYNTNKEKTQPIVIIFTSYAARREFFGKYLKSLQSVRLSTSVLDGDFPVSPIYINEHLDGFTRALFNQAKVLKKEKKLLKVAVRNGKVQVIKNGNSNFTLINSFSKLKAFDA